MQLSMWRCSDELRKRVVQLTGAFKKEAKHYIGMTHRAMQYNHGRIREYIYALYQEFSIDRKILACILSLSMAST